MLRQRINNALHKPISSSFQKSGSFQKSSPLQKSNPFSKSNPYRIKQKFLSQTKKSTPNDKLATNPQSHMYNRNYKQSPVAFESLSKENYRSSHYKQKRFNQIDTPYNPDNKMYSLQRRKEFIMEKFCPSDTYLQILKDKFIYTSQSQFQNVIRMSNLSISKFSNGRKDNTDLSNRKLKDNPFFRKKLLMGTSEQQNFVSSYAHEKSFHFINQPGKYIKGQYDYQEFYEPISLHNKDIYQSAPLNLVRRQSGSQRESFSRQANTRQSKNGEIVRHSSVRQSSPKNGQQTLECSFGYKEGRQQRKALNRFIDAVIQKNIQDPLKIQEKAKKQFSLNGKTYCLNPVQRLSS